MVVILALRRHLLARKKLPWVPVTPTAKWSISRSPVKFQHRTVTKTEYFLNPGPECIDLSIPWLVRHNWRPSWLSLNRFFFSENYFSSRDERKEKEFSKIISFCLFRGKFLKATHSNYEDISGLLSKLKPSWDLSCGRRNRTFRCGVT